MSFHTYTWRLLATAVLAALLNQSCKKADEFYNDLQNILQLAGEEYSYRSNYLVGDTIYFYGRFGESLDNDLRIRIGDAEGQLVSRSYAEDYHDREGDVLYDRRLQLVKVLVEESMGIGPDRPVVFSLAGQRLQGPSIYIRKAGTAPVFTDTLHLQQTGFDYDNAKRYFIQSWNGTGRVFYFNYENNSINVWENNVSTPLPVLFKDETDDFTITTVYSAHVDKAEKHLYFCASTKDAVTGTTAQRFCKVDLATAQLSTLNRTEGSIAGGPWEGPVSDVKLPAMRYLFVARDGKVYFHTQRLHRFLLTYAIGRIDASGQVTYLTGRLPGTTINNPPIAFSNPGGGSTTGPALTPLVIDPDRDLLYHLTYVETYTPRHHYILNVYDFAQQREVNSFVPENADFGVASILDAPFEAAKYDQGGAWFLLDDKPVFFLGSGNDYARNDRHAAVMVDFEGKETYTYAPWYTLDVGSINDRDVLNYTPEGHVIFKRSYYRNDEPDKYPGATLEVTEIKK